MQQSYSLKKKSILIMAKYRHQALLLLFVLIGMACTTTHKNNNVVFVNNNKVPIAKIEYEFIYELDNSPRVIGEIKSMDIIADTSLVISTTKPPQVIVFDKSGSQIREIGSVGRGPKEFLSPSIVRYHHDEFFVWCGELRRLIVFDVNGLPVKQYNLETNIKDFYIYDNYAYCYNNTGDIDKGLISVFDLDGDKFKKHNFGTASTEHIVLNMRDITRGMCINGNLLYCTQVSYPNISVIDLTTEDLVVSKEIIDPDFHLEKLSAEINDFIANQESIQYIYGSDIVTGIYPAESYIILRTKMGRVDMEGVNYKDATKREIKTYIFDYDFNLLKIHKALALEKGGEILSAHNGSIYAINLNSSLEAYVWERLNISLDTKSE